MDYFKGLERSYILFFVAVLTKTVSAVDLLEEAVIKESAPDGRSSFVDPCNPNFCPSNTRCINDDGRSACRDIPDEPCIPNPCLNDGYCYASGYNYQCSCNLRFSGTNCERSADSTPVVCTPNPCLNGGTCQPVSESYSCVCVNQFSGSHCQTFNAPKSICDGRNPCQNGCNCVESCRHASGYYCQGANGYLGKDCTIEPPSVVCGPNMITITVDDAFVREYDREVGNSRLHMAPTSNVIPAPNCFASTIAGVSHTFTMALPFTGRCGATVNTGANTVVSNNIWLNRETNDEYDMPVPVINFECTYTKEYIIITSLKPAVHTPDIIRAEGRERVQGVIELCKVSTSCPSSCPTNFALTQGAVYTVGEMLHLNIRGDQNSGGLVSLKSLHLSCGGSDDSESVVQLVSNGCPANTLNYMPTTITHSGTSSAACASFQVPRIQGCQVFYIHASLERCGAGGCIYGATSCQKAGRRRRATTLESLANDIYGPIYVIDGVQGIANEILFPNKSVVDTPARILDIPVSPSSSASEERKATMLIVGISVLCMFVVVSICSVFIYRYVTSSSLKE